MLEHRWLAQAERLSFFVCVCVCAFVSVVGGSRQQKAFAFTPSSFMCLTCHAALLSHPQAAVPPCVFACCRVQHPLACCFLALTFTSPPVASPTPRHSFCPCREKAQEESGNAKVVEVEQTTEERFNLAPHQIPNTENPFSLLFHYFIAFFVKLKNQLLRGLFYNVHTTGTEDEHTQSIHQAAEVFDPHTEQVYKYLQVFSACCVSFAHGANDVANAVGGHCRGQLVLDAHGSRAGWWGGHFPYCQALATRAGCQPQRLLVAQSSLLASVGRCRPDPARSRRCCGPTICPRLRPLLRYMVRLPDRQDHVVGRRPQVDLSPR